MYKLPACIQYAVHIGTEAQAIKVKKLKLNKK